MLDETHNGPRAIDEGQPAAMGRPDDGFEANLAQYQALLPSLVDREGQYIVLHDGVIAGFFYDYRDALKVGYDKFGLAAFLVKQVHQIEPVYYL